MSEDYKQFQIKNSDYSLIIENNGSVVYAYLLKGKNIISELWLYNIGMARYKTWDNIEDDDMPLQNLDKYIRKKYTTFPSIEDITIQWLTKKNYLAVYVYINDDLIGYLDNDNKIGYSVLVNQDTPIAKRLNLPIIDF